MSVAPPLSVVIPTLDEAACIEACIASTQRLREAGAQVVVSDGGSADDTVARAAAAGVDVVRGAAGRARQLNAGAARCRAPLLAFLHADCRPEPCACERLLALAGRSGPLWGRFDVRLDGGGAALRTIEAAMNLRSRITGIATGDQLMFATRDLFDAAGGFPPIALMEDVALSARLKRFRRPLCARERVTASSRKWRTQGVARTTLLMWRLRLAYAFGADPEDLARRYYARG